MKRFLAGTAVAALAVVMIGCSDDSTSPTPTAPYLPTTTGSYFVSNIEFIDTNDVSSSLGIDSTVYVGTKSVDGRTASIMESNFLTFTDSSYFQESSGVINSYTDVSLEAPNLSPIELGSRWMKIFQSNTGSWTAWDTTIAGYELDYNGIPVTADVAVKYEFTNKGTKNLTVDGKSVTCSEVEGTVTWTAQIAAPASTLTVPIKTTYYWAPGVGLVKAEQPPFRITIPTFGVNVEAPGFRQTLLRYTIK